MYGLVNKAVVDLVCTHFGEEAWQEIKRRAECDVDVFVGMDGYPDELTYRLVGAASEVLNLPAEKVLEAFGEYWVLYTAKEGYGEILRASGRDFTEFLMNLDAMHARVGIMMPNLNPPSFQVTDIAGDSIRLHYFSKRQGLGPMIVGLLKGLSSRFSTPIAVQHEKKAAEGADHDEFLIRFVAG
jgi:hypothetical protein